MTRAAVALAATAVMALGGVLSSAVPAGASVSAKRFYCGNLCNNKAPSYVIKSNGVQCSKSAKLLKTGHPGPTHDHGKSFGQTQPSVTVRVYYSPVCQTLWATVTNAGATYRDCLRQGVEVTSQDFLRKQVYTVTACPPPHKTVTMKMVNDHSASGKIAAGLSVFVQREATYSPHDHYGEFDFTY